MMFIILLLVATTMFGSEPAAAQSAARLSGVTTMDLPLASSIASAKIPPNVEAVLVEKVVDHPTSCSLRYTRGLAVPTGLYGEIRNAASGVYWEPTYSRYPVTTCQFGAIGDGSYDYATGAIEGTDNTGMLQRAIDFALQNRLAEVCMNGGSYKTSDTLHLGYGDAFYVIGLSNCAGSRPSFYQIDATTILPTKTDRCAINMQGLRNGRVANIQLVGQNYVHNAKVANTAPYPVVAEGWLDPDLARKGSRSGGIQPHAPYAGICIDAYSGTIATDHYPVVHYPYWTKANSQYGKAFSSNIDILDTVIVGFAVGVASQPNSDGNGDFIRIARQTCTHAVYCVAINNSQARNSELSNVQAAAVFAVLTNRFGARNAKLNGPIYNLSVGQAYEIFDIVNAGISQNITLYNIYAEQLVRIGSATNTTAYGPSILLSGCALNFYDETTGVIPAALLQVGLATTVTFESCSMNGITRIPALVGGGSPAGVTIDGGNFQFGVGVPKIFGTVAAASAVNYTGSAFVGSASTFADPTAFGRLSWLAPSIAAYMPTPTSHGSTQPMGSDAHFVKGRAQFTQSVTGFVDQLNRRAWRFAIGVGGEPLYLGDTTAGFVSTVAAYRGCDILTFAYRAARQADAEAHHNIAPGDLLYHYDTSTLFVVTGVSGANGSDVTITARQLNNMTIDTATLACKKNLIGATTLPNATYLHHTGHIIPQTVFFGDFTRGSAMVTNIHRGDGYGGNVSTYLHVGDRMLTYAFADDYDVWPYMQGARIAGVVDGSPASMTLSAPAQATGRFPILPAPVRH